MPGVTGGKKAPDGRLFNACQASLAPTVTPAALLPTATLSITRLWASLPELSRPLPSVP